MNSRGFTLIELLVVIAIIGILASVILGSLNDARDGAGDAKVQSEMDAVSKQSQISFIPTNGFDSVCGSGGVTQDPVIARLITSITTASGGTVVCNSNATEFAVSAPISTGFWCVDGDGVKAEIAASLTSGVTLCP